MEKSAKKAISAAYLKITLAKLIDEKKQDPTDNGNDTEEIAEVSDDAEEVAELSDSTIELGFSDVDPNNLASFDEE